MTNSAEQLTAEPLTLSDSDESLPPPLKWAGGKRWLVSHLKPLFHAYKSHRLVEPFVGGMAVSLKLNPRRALLNDLNPHLMNFYAHVKQGLTIEMPMRNEREFFFSQRARFNELIRNLKSNSKESAELFYYLNRTAFNGLCRFNSKGEFNVPFGKYARINYAQDFLAYQKQFSQWDFACGDFETLEISPTDFVYVDPPYDVQFTKYAKEDFNWDDQERLLRWLSRLRCPLVVSNQATERVLAAYEAANFTIQKLSAPRRISCNGDRASVWEMLATRNL
jgi:DNA adenine methylase